MPSFPRLVMAAGKKNDTGRFDAQVRTREGGGIALSTNR